MSGQDHERLSQGDPRAVVGITAMLGSLRAAIETERVKTGQERKIGHDDRSGQVSARVQRHPGPPVQVQGRQPTMQGFRVSRSRASEKALSRASGQRSVDTLIAGGNSRWQPSTPTLTAVRNSTRSSDGTAPASPRLRSSAPMVANGATTRIGSGKGSPRLDSPSNRSRPQSGRATSAARERESSSAGSMRASYTLPPDFPHDRIRVTTSPILPGVPVVIRSAEERTVNPERLSLDSIKFERCPILEHEYSLRLLNLQHNQITKIEHLTNLRNLIFLDLFDNMVSDVGGLDGVPSLRVLMLGSNRLAEISTAFWHVPNLDVLDVHANHITSIRNIDRLTNLRVLNLSFNMLTSIEGLGTLQLLAELNLRGNKIAKITATLEMLKRLERLNLGDNLIQTNADIEPVNQLTTLQELNLAGNQCVSEAMYRERWVGDLPGLRTLDGKKVGDEERRVASINLRKRAEKHKEATRIAMLKSQRESAIKTVKAAWESGRMAKGGNDRPSFFEIDGTTLALFGPAFDAFDKTHPPAITGIKVMFCPFDDFAAQIQKVRQRVPSALRLEIESTGMATFKHINALGSLRRIESLIIHESEPLVRNVTLWRKFVLYRLSHLPLKKLNGMDVAPGESAEAKDAFSALDRLIEASAAIGRHAQAPQEAPAEPTESRRRKDITVSRRASSDAPYQSSSGASAGTTKKDGFRKSARELRPVSPKTATRISQSFITKQAAEAVSRYAWSTAIDDVWDGVVENYLSELLAKGSG